MKKTKAKVIICRRTEQYAKYMGNGEFGTCNTPYLHPLTFTIKGLADYVEKYEDINLDVSDYYTTIVEINEVQSDNMGE